MSVQAQEHGLAWMVGKVATVVVSCSAGMKATPSWDKKGIDDDDDDGMKQETSRSCSYGIVDRTSVGRRMGPTKHGLPTESS